MDEDKTLIEINSYKEADNIASETIFKPKKFSKLKSILLSLVIIVILAAIGASYAYFTPTSFVIVKANAEINLKVNRWDKIIDVSSLNTNGGNILGSMKLKYKNINDGLILILSTMEQNNYINALSPDKKDQKISIFISGENINTSTFSNIVRNRKFDLEINQNGTIAN